MKSRTTTSITLDTRRQKKTGKYPVKLCINHITTAKYYGTGVDMTNAEFDSLSAKRLSRASAAVNNELNTLQAQAIEIIQTLKPFSFTTFEKRFFRRSTQKGSLLSLYQQQIDELTRQERLGTASSYQCSIKSLLAFKDKLSLESITVDFLRAYEQWMTATKNASKTTIGIYTRALRAVFNEGIERGLISRESYPFGKKKYQIPTGRNVKKALSMEDISKFYYYEPDVANEWEERAKDFWLFSYFGNGINMKDVALLKYKNVQEEYIVFERAKTERARRSSPKPITIYITAEMREIIERRGNVNKAAENYLFPILEPGMGATRRREVIQQFIKNTNKWTKRIAEKLGIPFKVTSYTARHSFSTVLKRSGASTEFISEALGHTDVKTTESYLDSFENDMKKQFALHLTMFKKEINQS